MVAEGEREEQKGSLTTASSPVASAGPKPLQRLSFPGNSAKVALLNQQSLSTEPDPVTRRPRPPTLCPVLPHPPSQSLTPAWKQTKLTFLALEIQRSKNGANSHPTLSDTSHTAQNHTTMVSVHLDFRVSSPLWGRLGGGWTPTIREENTAGSERGGRAGFTCTMDHL